ncbi:EF hand domain-containing protein [Ditylenchus destructor]|uniref:EF hand domain-containing protein n=1 Tax=Ditylenchus destructor TaxID=166010 RepID=A0AAD4R4C0_9BILA|nr:EF hand domain-containing protein [Ditylenchus destructor]
MKISTIVFFVAFALINVSASPLRSESVEDIFKSFDANGDGKLDLDEIKAALALSFSHKVSSEDLDPLARYFLRLLDLNEDGFITLDEVRKISDPEAFFEILDKDGDGKLSFDEFRAYFQKLFPDGLPGSGSEGLREAFNKIDTDQDGYISQDELYASYHPQIQPLVARFLSASKK